MSVKIRIELRDSESIINKGKLTKAELFKILQSALPEDDDGIILHEPFFEHGAQILIVEADDPRGHWTSKRTSSQEGVNDLE